MFGDTWLETSAGRYREFEDLADASLRATCRSLGLDLSNDDRAALVGAYSTLDVWPDVKPALARLRGAGIRLGFLSNLGETLLRTNMRNAGITDDFELVSSTDRVKRFKPSPLAYQMAIDGFKLLKAEIGFVAFGGWDAVGATWFGYRTAWINRLDAADEQLDAQPAIVTKGIEGALMLAGL